MIEIQNLEKNYWIGDNKTQILRLDHLVLNKGERVSLTGQSGSGKSTLLHIIGGVLNADSGSLKVDGQDLMGLNQSHKDQFRSQKIGYVFQDFHLIPSLTAEENVALILPKYNKQEREHVLGEWFNKVGLEGKRKHKPAQLSRGQQQRVAIIRAFIHKPTILLADEPTGSLDQETAQYIIDLMLQLSEENKQTLLCVTHDTSLANKFPKVCKMSEINSLLKREEKLA